MKGEFLQDPGASVHGITLAEVGSLTLLASLAKLR
jgi:hypothetical protein